MTDTLIHHVVSIKSHILYEEMLRRLGEAAAYQELRLMRLSGDRHCDSPRALELRSSFMRTAEVC